MLRLSVWYPFPYRALKIYHNALLNSVSVSVTTTKDTIARCAEGEMFCL